MLDAFGITCGAPLIALVILFLLFLFIYSYRATNSNKIKHWSETRESIVERENTGGAEMSEAEQKFKCSECDTVHDTSQEAKECCSAKAKKVFTCSDCDNEYETKEEAEKCCITDLDKLKERVTTSLNQAGIKFVELNSFLFGSDDYEFGTHERQVDYEIFFRFLSKLGTATNEIYLFADDDAENDRWITLWFISPKEIAYAVVIGTDDEIDLDTLKGGIHGMDDTGKQPNPGT